MARAARPQTQPDRALAFPAVATWLAVRADDPEQVVRALGLRTVLPCNWASGVANVVREGVFATPSIGGWVLVVGHDLAVATQDAREVETLLPPLSEQFGSAQWFSTDEERDVHGWAVAERGQLVRGYGYIEEHGHCYWHGEVTAAESDLGCFVDDPRDQSHDEIKWWPDRRTVLALAAAWSLDPSQLGESTHVRGSGDVDVVGTVGVGWLGRM